MKLTTAVNIVKVTGGLGILSGRIICVEAGLVVVFLDGAVTSTGNRRSLEQGALIDGHVVMGKSGDNEIFIATNATNFPQGTLNGTLTITVSPSEECTPEAYDKALPFQLKVPVAFVIDALGMIEGENGWHTQPIRELEGNTTLPVSLVELMSGVAELMSGVAELFDGVAFNNGLVVYVLGAEEELLGCASMKKVDDEEVVAEYNALFNDLYQEEAVKEVPLSASKNGLFVFVSTIAAVGIAILLGDVLAL